MVELQEGDDHVPERWIVEYDGARFMDQRATGACVALDPVTRLCILYDHRPAVCRSFARGGALCRGILAGPAALRLLAVQAPPPSIAQDAVPRDVDHDAADGWPPLPPA